MSGTFGTGAITDEGLTVGASTGNTAADRHRAVRCAAGNARNTDELIDWLGALGLTALEGK